IRDFHVTGVQTCALPICLHGPVHVALQEQGRVDGANGRPRDSFDAAVQPQLVHGLPNADLIGAAGAAAGQDQAKLLAVNAEQLRHGASPRSGRAGKWERWKRPSPRPGEVLGRAKSLEARATFAADEAKAPPGGAAVSE